MWNAIYDCLFFCMNQEIYDSFTPEQQAVIDEAGQKAVEYQRYINRAGIDEIKDRWVTENGMTITEIADIDIESFKAAVDGVDEWYVGELESQGFENVDELVKAFTEDVA